MFDFDLDRPGGIEYEYPKKPLAKDIRNYGLPRIKQVWSRHTEYEQFDWSDGWQQRIVLPENEDQLRYLEEEVDRLYNGEWIYINNKPTYINNYCYFFLQWMLLENEYYPEFRDTCLYYFRFVEICEKAKLCLGHVLIKGRRLGASSMEAAVMLLQALIYRNSHQGIISKDGETAQSVFDFVVTGFQALPPFLKPSTEGNDAPKKLLSIKKQAGKITKDRSQAGNREGLNNKISHKANSSNAYDGLKLLRILCDESAKWTENDINNYVKVVGKCLTKGARVVGKGAIVSTVNRADAGGDNFKRLWEQSDQLGEVNRLGQTPSKYFRLFIPACYGYEGYIDQYGNSVIENPTDEQKEYLKGLEEEGICPDHTIGAKDYILMQRELLKNDEDGLQEEIRQAPLTWKEVFDTAGKKIYFDRKSHETQLEHIREKLADMGRDPDKGENGRRGWFRERDDNIVFFQDDPDGLWYILQFPENPNQYDRSEINGTPRYRPTNTAWGGAGLDPIAHADATVEKGSDACVIIRRRYTITDPDKSGMPVAMFLGRMTKKSDFHKQVFLGIRYYGVRMLGERAPSDWCDWAKENGYNDYLLGMKRSDGTEVKGAMPQNKEYLEEHLTEMVESSYKDVEKIWFRRLIADRLGFDMKDRTDYDSCIADGNALITLKEKFEVHKIKTKGRKFLMSGRVLNSR